MTGTNNTDKMNHQYVELHCHSNYSFQEGASFINELLTHAVELGYTALAITDHDNLCGAMEFTRVAHSVEIQPIIGAEVTLTGGYHLTLLVENRQGYGNLCQIISDAHLRNDRKKPEIDSRFLENHAEGLILLSGCRKGEVASLVASGHFKEAEVVLNHYLEYFGTANVYVELQNNLVYGDTERNRNLVGLSRKLEIATVATNNVHYHVRERHQLQDCLVAIKQLKRLEECHRERRANSEFYLKSPQKMVAMFQDYPEAISNTLNIAKRCAGFDLTRDLKYKFPESSIPQGFTQESYLRYLCNQAAIRRYGALSTKVKERLDKEFNLIRRHNLAGFFLIYHDIIQIARAVMIDLELTSPKIPLEENPPGRGRGSSVAMLIGYLIGLSHIDPLQFNLSLDRFLPDDDMASVPDIDLDFPRNIREELIKRVHKKYGFDHAALTGMIPTYKLKSATRALGKALGLPLDQVYRLAKQSDHSNAGSLHKEMTALTEFQDILKAPGWTDLIRLAKELDGFPKYLAQHPGGMVINSTPLTEIVPIQPGAIEGRYVMQWNKDSIDEAGFVKIDFLALGTLSQIQDSLDFIVKRTGHRPDLSRINFNDEAVYDMLCQADTIGVFQVESAAQIQTITRIKPRNLVDMAHEVAAVRPGVGANDGITEYIARRNGKRPEKYDHTLEKQALERTKGVILFQDQVNQLAIDVAGFSPLQADQLRRTYGRYNNTHLMKTYWNNFRDGSARKGVDEKTSKRIFNKFNRHYMFPESHAYAFGITAYQSAWLKYYYPLEFYTGLFNQQPMGFYSLETLKQDAKKHGIQVLNPDINLSLEKCVPEKDKLRLGFLHVTSIGPTAAKSIVHNRKRGGAFHSLEDFMRRTGLLQEAFENLTDAGAFITFSQNRRKTKWEIGLRYRPATKQTSFSLPVQQDIIDPKKMTQWDLMEGEYRTLGLYPGGHIMAHIRQHLNPEVMTSQEVVNAKEGMNVTIAGLVIRRQRPLGKAIFITLEDEWGHSPIIIWPRVYEKYRHVLTKPLILAHGTVSRRENTMNIVLLHARELPQLEPAPHAKNWR